MKEDEIDVAVVIQVGGHHRDAARLRPCDAENVGDVRKGPISVVAEHAVAISIDGTDVKIEIAIVVVIDEGRRDRLGSRGDCAGDLLKPPLPHVAEKFGWPSQKDIGHAIVVVVPNGGS